MHLQVNAASDEVETEVPEERWGQKTQSLASNGVAETARKFRAHVRRALILYILLLKDVGDLDTLSNVVSTLRTDSFVSYSDIGR